MYIALLYGDRREYVNATGAHRPPSADIRRARHLAWRLSPVYLFICMTFKLDGAKFSSIEELIEALFPLYEDRMSEEEFRKYVEENAERG
ncbi:MAG: hypothetical protein Q8M76_11875 [Spirochaetaceae bacterium]|nr:hypothetical protein [Spirochaetaceae bacterium]